MALLRFDPAREPDISIALWVPVFWMFIVGTRLPSQWLGWTSGIAAQALEEGNPADRVFLSLLILLALITLAKRSFNWTGFFFRNLGLTAFLLFALVSFVWSDFPLIALKRWFRDLGNYFMVLVVLSDPHPLEAVRTVLRRFCFLVIPLSVTLVKYFPELAKHYSPYSGVAEFVGAATSKNMLGSICMISGIYLFWDTVTRWSARKERKTKWVIRLNLVFLLMTLWMLNLSQSATSEVCLVLGCVVILLFHSAWGRRHLALLRILVPVTFCLYVILAFGFNLNGAMVSKLGRDPTLTDRTVIWRAVLNQHTNPVVGTGYESFWLGPRLEGVWQYMYGINEAHNGYLDMYVNLGVIGVLLLVTLLIACYQTIGKQFTSSFAMASLGMAIWAVTLFYNVTEAAFKGGMLWLVLMITGTAIPQRVEHPVPERGLAEDSNPMKRHPKPAMRMVLRNK